MWKKVLCSECIFWQRNVSADCPVIERKDLALVLKLVVATLSLETENVQVMLSNQRNDQQSISIKKHTSISLLAILRLT